jgi:carbon storage regulator CsrA
MLVLRRLSGQAITIGKNAEIIVKVLQNKDGIVSIGVDAPLSVSVDRMEIYKKRLNELPSSDNQKFSLLNRLEIFQNKLKKMSISNDLLIKDFVCDDS